MCKRFLIAIYANIRAKYAKCFPYTIINEDNTLIEHLYDFKKTYLNLPVLKKNRDTDNKIRKWRLRTEQEYIYKIKGPGFKDKYHGWLIHHRKELIFPSIPQNLNPIYGRHPLPNRIDYTFRKHEHLKFQTIISCDGIHRFGPNYFHFFLSFIGQLALLDSCNINLKYPIIIPPTLRDLRYFQELIKLSPKLATLNFIFADSRIIHFEKAYFAKSNPYDIKTVANIHRFLQLPRYQKSFNISKIFLNRKKGTLRSIQNIEEIEKITSTLGYQTVYTEDLSLKDQITLFQNATQVIAIHGAGLTNLIFKFPNKVHLFEIFPENWFVAGYYNLTHQSGGVYSLLIGKTHTEKTMLLDPVKFKREVMNWENNVIASYAN